MGQLKIFSNKIIIFSILLASFLAGVGCGATQAAPEDETLTRPTATAVSTPTTLAQEEAGEVPGGLSENAIITLSSLELVDDYPLYTMYYAGPYQRPSIPEDRTSKADSLLAWGCSLFAALADADNRLLGRNFDWEYSPALLLFTDPPDGYASVSMVDIVYLGFDRQEAATLMELPFTDRQGLLNAPRIPFDGLNEMGLAVGMAAVPPGQPAPDPDKETIGSLMAIRLMLDYAATADEAVAVLEDYNIDMGGGPPIHYLIVDARGRSLLAEFYDGELIVTPNESSWHQATNFLRAAAGESAEGQCWRYDILSDQLMETGGALTTLDAVDLLAEVKQPNTQWSIVYGMSSGAISVAMGGQFEHVHTFQLDLVQ